MSKMRLYEVAKNLDLDSKELVKVVKELGIDVKNHMSSLTEEQVDKVLEYFAQLEFAKANAVVEEKSHKKEKKESKPAKEEELDVEEIKKPKKPKSGKVERNEKISGYAFDKNTLIDDEEEESDKFHSKKGGNKKKWNKKNQRQDVNQPKPADSDVDDKLIKLPATLTVKDFAKALNKPVSEIVQKLMMQGKMMTANQEMDFKLAEELALGYDYLVEQEAEVDIVDSFFADSPEDEKNLIKRPPVVVVMGHVDHGKTSLLDAIKKTNVTATEQGGITQHIGAYSIDVHGEKITFLDTPGHEAFTAMRLRGAMATDIAILVVAADDGVMPQTVEAINHAKAAGVQIIVAVNKIDKPSANLDRVKQELTEHGLIAEDWGGSTIMVPVSAATKEGIDELLDMIVLVAEMGELKANPNTLARGIVIEARLDKGRGAVATMLIQRGTLKIGDSVVIGATHGRVRAMMDDKGRPIKKAGPSTPVEILGLNDVPLAGESFYVAKNEKDARYISEKVRKNLREKMIQATPQKVTLDDLFQQIQEGEMKELKLIVKADVQGSVEAVRQSLEKLSNEEVLIRIIHGGVGAINESDVMLASASNAIIIGFNVRPENNALSTAEQEGIDIRLYRVIYNAIEDIELAMKGMLDPVFKEEVQGHCEIRDTFKVSGLGTIGGAHVTDGKITRSAKVRLLRDNIVIYEGGLASLKRFKDDAKEVASGFDCGIMLEKFNDIKTGDILEAYVMKEVER
ncbi:translation initiation factor IF-2 [Clostridiales bacterium COT073_COT-073]|nr:translation initiation factor IF-2 [Clostridiales bacterium COT073_COT-073]